MFLKELKLFKLAMPFILGTLLATQINEPLSQDLLLILGILLGLLLCFIPFKYHISKKWIPNSSLFLSLMLFSFISAYSEIDRYHPFHFSHKNSDNHIFQILSIAEKKNTIQCIAQINTIIQDKEYLNVLGKALIYFNKNDLTSALNVSDVIYSNSTFSPTTQARNPNQFNYASYLQNMGINHTIFINNNNWIKLNNKPINSFKNKIADAKQALQQKINKIILHDDAYAVSSALVLGDRGHLSQEVKENFQHTGGMHVLAVSGLHVGLIAVLLIYICRFSIPSPFYIKITQALIIITGIWAYSFITGLPDSAFRAAIMASLYIFSKAFNKKTNSINILIAALIVSLYIDPLALYKVGFQFSYLALFSILIFYKPIANLIVTKYSWINKFWQLNALSISAQILISPISIYYFSVFPIYFLLTNIFAINFASIILYSHCFYFVTEALESLLSNTFYFSEIWAFYINLELDAFIKVLSLIKNIPRSSTNILISFSELIVLYSIILLLSLMFFRKKISFGLLALLMSIFFVFHRFQTKSNKSNKIITQIYYLKKGHIIDFKLNDTIYSLQSTLIDTTEKAFNVLPNRDYYEIKKTIEIPFNENIKKNRIYKKDYLLRFQNTHFLIYDTQVPLAKIKESFPVDYALLKDFNTSDLTKIQLLFQPKEYIFLYNKNYESLKLARNFCMETPSNCHFVNSDYAKTINYE